MKLTSDNPTSKELIPILNELEKNDPQTLELLRDFTMLNPK
jgi:hypothetical protein